MDKRTKLEIEAHQALSKVFGLRDLYDTAASEFTELQREALEKNLQAAQDALFLISAVTRISIEEARNEQH